MAVRRIGDSLVKFIKFIPPALSKVDYTVTVWAKCHTHTTTNNNVVVPFSQETSTGTRQFGGFRFLTGNTGNILNVVHRDIPGDDVNADTAIRNQGWQWFMFQRYSEAVDPTTNRSTWKNAINLIAGSSPSVPEGDLNKGFEVLRYSDTGCDYSFFDLRLYSRMFLVATGEVPMLYASQGKDGIVSRTTGDYADFNQNLLLRTCIANKATNGTDTGDLAQCNDYGPLKLTPDMTAVDANFQSVPDPWSPWTIGG